ncbi:MAG: glycerophosphodiester phosphodiesterase [Acidobacteriota bacterium]
MSLPVYFVMMALIIAHRGASGESPENTLAAVQRAIDLESDFVEIDIHYSGDGEMIVIHDATVERTTSGKGVVSEMTLADIKRLDAGSWFNSRFAEEKVPTLEEVLQLVRPSSSKLLIEIKEGNGLPEDFAGKLLGAIEEHGMQSRVIVQSFDHSAVKQVGAVATEIPTAALIGEETPDPVGETKAAGAEILAIRHTLATLELIKKTHDSGLRFFVWTVDDPATIRRMLEWGVDAVISNYPDRVREVAMLLSP